MLAEHFDVSLYLITEIARVATFVVPIVAYIITKRVCLGLQRKDMHLMEHGLETGIVRQLPSGEFVEVTRPLDEEALAKIAPPEPLELTAGTADGDGAEAEVPPPGMRGGIGRIKARLNKVVNENVPMNGHANGHGPNGQEDHGEPAAIGSSSERDGSGEHDSY